MDAGADEENPFLTLIRAQSVRSQDELRSAYRRLVIATHPDSTGSNVRVEIHLKLDRYYREAKRSLQAAGWAQVGPVQDSSTSHRLTFFRHLHSIERLEMPYAFHPEVSAREVEGEKRRAADALSSWRPDLVDVYTRAAAELSALKRSRPSGPYMRKALGLNVRPLLHNITSFHLTGRPVYRRQAHQNLRGILDRLAVEGYTHLRDLLEILVEDMEDGAALVH